jgi:hypothetical protein
MNARLLLLLVATAATTCPVLGASTIDAAAVDGALGRTGQMMDGGVYRVAFPRTDLSVTIGNVKLLPGFALGGYAAFVPTDRGSIAVGDLVLLDGEIGPVMNSLQHSGFDITALHNHLRNERPHVMYMHFMGSGDAAHLAGSLRQALALSKTPLAPLAKSRPQALDFKDAVERGLGRSGKVSGAVLSISAPRADPIAMNGTTIPPAAGVATAMNFEDAGNGTLQPPATSF